MDRGMMYKVGDSEHELVFTLSSIEKIQEHYDLPLEVCMEMLKDERHFIEAAWTIGLILVNDDIEYKNYINSTDLPIMTRQQFGWVVEFKDLAELLKTIWKAYALAFPKEETSGPKVRRRSQKSSTSSGSSWWERLRCIFQKDT